MEKEIVEYLIAPKYHSLKKLISGLKNCQGIANNFTAKTVN